MSRATKRGACSARRKLPTKERSLFYVIDAPYCNLIHPPTVEQYNRKPTLDLDLAIDLANPSPHPFIL